MIILGPTRNDEYEARVRRLVDMGVEKETAISILSSRNWDLEVATEFFFS